MEEGLDWAGLAFRCVGAVSGDRGLSHSFDVVRGYSSSHDQIPKDDNTAHVAPVMMIMMTMTTIQDMSKLYVWYQPRDKSQYTFQESRMLGSPV